MGNQIGEAIAFILHPPDNEKCPFCPGDKEGPWTTYPGEENSAEILRTVMHKPSVLGREQNNARPKDDEQRPTYETKAEGVIYEHHIFGEYGNQAHHAISGKQIMSGNKIEKLICQKLGEIEADTGYSVNNCANGVCLPSYPKRYSKRDAAVKWSEEDPGKKKWATRLPMAAGKGQVHIGEHDIPEGQRVAEIHDTTYPAEAKRMLEELYDVTMTFVVLCPWCYTPDGAEVRPLPPPYRINQRLDGISGHLIQHITASAESWVYFISKYARDYHYELCTHPRSRQAR